MSERTAVARNTKRMLWAEAIGHCMNPECQVELIKDGVSIGEMAHIKARADGGDVSFDNLLLLWALLNEWEVVLSWRHEAKTASLQSSSQEKRQHQEIPVSDT